MRARTVKCVGPGDRQSYRHAFLAGRADTLESTSEGGLIATGTQVRADGSLWYFLADFVGRSLRPDRRTFGLYASKTVRDMSVQLARAAIASRTAVREARRVARSTPHSLQVGSILYCSWGYEQTNVEFYEVVAVRGAAVDIRELAQRSVATGDMTGRSVPAHGEYINAPIRGKRLGSHNQIRLTSYKVATVWDGQPKNWSTYA
jgi:hypothetical protein